MSVSAEADNLLMRLHDSEERFRAVFESAGLGIAEVDVSTRFLAVNERWCQIVRRSREELLRMDVLDLTHPDDRPESVRVHSELVEGRVTQISYEKRYLQGDGGVVWVRVTTSTIHGEHGEFARGLALLEDITERKRAEEAIKSIALFPDENPDPIFRVDQAGTLLYANRASRCLLDQWDCHEGQQVTSETIRQTVKEALEIGRRELELNCGEIIYSFLVFPLAERGYANLYGRDITRRKKAEQDLAKATARLNGIIFSAMDAVVSMDASQQIMLFNPAASRMFGIPAEKVIGQSINRLIPARFREAHPRYVDQFGKTGVSSRQMGALGAICGLRANGEEFPIEASISQTEVAGEKMYTVILRDITQRKRIEEALLRSEEKFRLAIDGADLGTWDWDLVTDTLVWSDRCKQMFGLASDAVITHEVRRNALHPDDQLRIKEEVNQAIQDKADYNTEFRTRWADGTIHWVNARGRAFYDEQGRPVRMSGTVHDITEIVEAREALARSRSELERVIQERTAKLRETIDDLEHFSYSITHDMRAPLRAMQSFAFLLNEECSECMKPQGRDYLRRIEMAARRMDNLIQDSLDYAKVLREELPLGRVDVGQLLREMLESYPNLQRWAGHIEIAFDHLTVIGNVAGLTQCFSNLLGNATKFVAPGVEPRVRIWAEVTNQQTVRIWIEDNGVGIPEGAREKIFRMFHQLHVDSEYSGTGIGLAIVRKAVQRMGGEVGVESELGKGSRFWVDLNTSGLT